MYTHMAVDNAHKNAQTMYFPTLHTFHFVSTAQYLYIKVFCIHVYTYNSAVCINYSGYTIDWVVVSQTQAHTYYTFKMCS